MAQYDLMLFQNEQSSGIAYTERFVNIAKGGLLSADSSGVPTILPAGTDGYYLKRDNASATGLSWAPVSGGSMVYPGAGIANSTGSAWGTSYTTTGSGTIIPLQTSPQFLGTPNIGNVAGSNSLIGFNSSSLSRWQIGKNSEAESGSNVGSNFVIHSYNDAGTFLAQYFSIVRNSGLVTVHNSLQVLSNIYIQEAYLSGSVIGDESGLYYNENDERIATYDLNLDEYAYFNGYLYGNNYGIVCNSPLTLFTSTTSNASLRIPHGVTPTTPTNGDMWTTTSGLYVRINGSTVGPLGSGGGTPAGSNTQIQYNNSGSFGASSSFIWNDTTKALTIEDTSSTLNPRIYLYGGNSSSSNNMSTALELKTISNYGTQNLSFQAYSGAGTNAGGIIASDNRLILSSSYIYLGSGTSGILVNSGYSILFYKLGIFSASNGTLASIRITPGGTPSSLNDGDMWTTTSGLYVRINGSTVGPLSAAGVGLTGTTSSTNTLLGLSIASALTSGTQNVAIGATAAHSATSNNSYNVYLGHAAGYYHATGQGNVLVGNQASDGITGGANNTSIGGLAGHGGSGSISGCVYLGYGAGSKETNSNVFMVENQDNSTEYAAREHALMYGRFNSTVSSQYITMNAYLNVRYFLSVGTELYMNSNNAIYLDNNQSGYSLIMSDYDDINGFGNCIYFKADGASYVFVDASNDYLLQFTPTYMQYVGSIFSMPSMQAGIRTYGLTMDGGGGFYKHDMSYQALGASSSFTHDTDTTKNSYVTATGNCTYTLTNLTNGKSGEIYVSFAGTYNFTLTTSTSGYIVKRNGTWTSLTAYRLIKWRCTNDTLLAEIIVVA